MSAVASNYPPPAPAFELLSPAWLLALALVVLLALLERRRFGFRGAIPLRALLLGALVLALADPVLRLEEADRATVFVVDRSESIPLPTQEEALRKAQEEAAGLPDPETTAILSFAATTTLQAPGMALPSATMDNGLNPEGGSTDLGLALKEALSLLPADRPGRIVLFTDGHDTHGGVDAALAELRERGVGLELRPLQPTRRGPRVRRVELGTGTAAPGATLQAVVDLQGPFSGPLIIEAGEEELARLEVELGEGEHRRSIDISLPIDLPAGLLRLEARLGESAEGAVVVPVGVEISRPPHILLLGHDPRDTRPLEAALQADGIRVETLRPNQLPADLPAPLKEVDAVILTNTPMGASTVPALPAAALAPIEAFVRGGGGLVVIGGDHAYDQGAYEGSRIQSLLPVELAPEGKAREPAVALVIILDKSGSMARPAAVGALDVSAGVMDAMVGGRPVGSKMELVDEAAAAAVEKLRTFDTVGLVAVDSEAHWAVPLQSTEPRRPLLKRIRSITAGGGGIFAVQALLAARDALRNSEAPIRHVILFADAADAGDETSTVSTKEGRLTANALAAELGREGITLSVIGVGDKNDKDADFLRSLATDGGGRFELSRDIAGIRTLFVSETEQVMKTNLDEAPFAVVEVGWHPALRGIELGTAPPLLGRNKLKSRPRARLLLATPAGDPILSSWSVGLGEVVALSTDAGSRWAAPWLRWSGYPLFWVQMSRHFAARSGEGAQKLVLSPRAGGLDVELRTRDPWDRSQLIPGARARVNGGEPVPLSPVAPGIWGGHLPVPAASLLHLTVEDLSGAPLVSKDIISRQSEERLHDELNTPFFAATAASGEAPAHRRAWSLWPLCTLLATLLLPVDAWMRRPLRNIRLRNIR